MATYNGVNKAKAVDPSGANILDKGLYGGKVRIMHDTYIMDGTESALETIAVGGVLPAGARIVEVILDNDILGATCTVSVGDSNTAARYISGVNAAGALTSRIVAAQAIAARAYKIGTVAGDNQVLITFATLATPTALADLAVTIMYTLE